MAPKTLLVIGSGPGGYVAALEGAERGFSVTLVDRDQVGGTCLNRGCIPSKFILAQAKRVDDALRLKDVGIEMRLASVSMAELLKRKAELLDVLRRREEQAIKTAGIRRLDGNARFASPHEMTVDLSTGAQEIISFDAVVLATGSSIQLPAIFPAHPAILTSTTILELSYLPKHLVVVGGGYIGCEMACAFRGLGSTVTMIERENQLMPAQPEISAASALLQRSFLKRGINVFTGTSVTTATASGERQVTLALSNGETIQADAVLVAVGRTPNVQNLGLEKAGLSLEKGRLPVNHRMQTAVPHIYAIGDVVSPLPLAHTASWEADLAVRSIAGETVTPLAYSSVPCCVYTWPEIAWVGLNEESAREAGFEPRLDRVHVAGNSKAMAESEPDGFWILISDSQTGKILGSQIIGPHATELVHLATLAIRGGLTTEQIADTVFAHPTVAESFRDVALRARVKEKTRSAS